MRVTMLQHEILAVDPAELAHSLAERFGIGSGRSLAKEPDVGDAWKFGRGLSWRTRRNCNQDHRCQCEYRAEGNFQASLPGTVNSQNHSLTAPAAAT